MKVDQVQGAATGNDAREMARERLLTTEQTADFLSIRAHTLIYWRCKTKADGPDFIKLGRLVRYRVADIVRFLRRARVRRESQREVG